MHQKNLVKQAWQAAGLYQSKDAKLQQFLKLIDGPLACWPELVDECRRNYAKYKTRLAQPIINTGDTLLRLNLVRVIDAQYDDEVQLLRTLIQQSDPQKDEPELKAVALKNVPALTKAIAAKPGLSKELESIVRPKPVAQAPQQRRNKA
jgi:hypothetical protein